MKKLLSTLGIIILLAGMGVSGYSMISNLDAVSQNQSSEVKETEANVKQDEDNLLNTVPQNIQDFSASFIKVEKTAENAYLLTNTFSCEESFESAWYAYEVGDKDNPVLKTKYSADNFFEFVTPDTDKQYTIKVFIKNSETGEKKSVWITNL